MIELTNSVAQTIEPGAAVAFDTIVMHTGCGECYRQRNPSVKLRFRGVYEASFSGNVAAGTDATPVQLAVSFGGVALPESVMVSTPTTANTYNNISTSTYVENSCGDYDRVSIVNSGTSPVILSANMRFTVRRLA